MDPTTGHLPRGPELGEIVEKMPSLLPNRRLNLDAFQWAPVIEDFACLIEGDPQLKLLANNIFKEIPDDPAFERDPSGQFPRIKDYKELLSYFNYFLKSAPKWDWDVAATGFIGVPFNALLNWPMATESGQKFFLHPRVNKKIKAMLSEWGKFLQSDSSQYALKSWLQPDCLCWLSKKAGHPDKTFDEIFCCDPSLKDTYGYMSWDAFFVREFCDGLRPIASPNDDNIIVSACEAAPYCFEQNAKTRDKFWLKDQPYSLVDMLWFDDDLTQSFVGGSVYQAFLPVDCYHRWHAPISGKIKRVKVVPGAYYSQLRSRGFPAEDEHKPDPCSQNLSMRYITSIATRALIFIEADNHKLGTLCFVAVGMGDVSSCEITVAEHQHVTKGDLLGSFHLGGSTYCLVFQPGANLELVEAAQGPYPPVGFESRQMVRVNSKLATVK